jgi:hypothetical protein
MGRHFTRRFIHAGRGKQIAYISTYAGAYRLNLLQETLPGTGGAEILPLAKNKNSHQRDNGDAQISKWVSQYPEWNCVLNTIEVSRLSDPSIVGAQRVASLLERLA